MTVRANQSGPSPNAQSTIGLNATDEGPVVRGDDTLVGQLVRWVERRIEDRVFRAGSRLPSIRQLATNRGVSRFTVVEAYERLVALGAIESRRGSGFYVREIAPRAPIPLRDRIPNRTMDVPWLLRNMFGGLPPYQMPGGGLPPPDWLDAGLVAAQLRAIGRQPGKALLDYGTPQGFLPLRQQLQRKLAELEIAADPAQIVLTNGATQAIELVARRFLRPGDAVFVDDPAWFLQFGIFAALGADVIGIPRLLDGPDMNVLEEMAAIHKPRLYVVHSVLHNPTSTSLSAAKAFQILKLASQYDFLVVEDDVYGDLHPGASARLLPATRMASLDQLQRVLYVGSFSKTLAANLRVGFVACDADQAMSLSDLKLLCGLTSPELGERMVYRVLSEGHYRKHVERLRGRFDAARPKALRALERVGLTVQSPPSAGMFIWARAGSDTRPIDAGALTTRMLERGYLLAPGSLFSPSQLPSAWMRFNIATSTHAGMLDALAQTLQEVT